MACGWEWHDGIGMFKCTENRLCRKCLTADRDRLSSELHAVREELDETKRLLEKFQRSERAVAEVLVETAIERDRLRGALRDIWPFIEEDDGGLATPTYQRAIDGVRAALSAPKDGAT